MSLWRIAWRSIQQRGVASSLTALSMALGVTLVVAVLLIHGVVTDSFQNQASFGYNMIVGAKGGKLQLALNTVYYLSEPVENIPFSYYLEFLPEHERVKFDGAEARDGKFADYINLAIPLCLGDYYGRFRVVGTTPEMFNELRYGESADREFKFAQGRNFHVNDSKNGFFEAVVGAKVAREMNVELGQKVQPSHGAPEERGGSAHETGFTVVGILEPTGTPQDRGVFVNMEGFFLMEGHAKPVDEEEEAARQPPAEEDAAAESHPSGTKVAPLPIKQREVTSMLVQTVNPLIVAGLENTINEGQEAQAVLPVKEIYNLFENIVGPINKVLLLLTVMICVVSGIAILVSIYNSMSERRREIAVMRALGARRGQIMAIVLLESIILAVGGGLLGWVAGHGLIGVFSGRIEEDTGVAIRFFDFAPGIEEMPLWGEWALRVPYSTELLLIPGLIVLAICVGLWPAFSAYRTDVAKSLSP